MAAAAGDLVGIIEVGMGLFMLAAAHVDAVHLGLPGGVSLKSRRAGAVEAVAEIEFAADGTVAHLPFLTAGAAQLGHRVITRAGCRNLIVGGGFRDDRSILRH